MSEALQLVFAPSFVREIDEKIMKPENHKWHDLADRLRKKLTTEGRFRYIEYHDIICLFLNKDRYDAILEICKSRKITYTSADPGLTRVLNNGFIFTPDEVSALYDRGLIRGSENFYSARNGLEKGGLFDSARKLIDPMYDDLMLHAIEYALKKNNKSARVLLSPTTLKYVPVLLMKDGQVKADHLERLFAIHKSQYTGNIVLAHNAISYLGKALGVPLDESFAVEKRSAHSFKKYEPKSPDVVSASSSFHTASNSNLRNDLIKISDNMPSLKRAAMIYLWLQNINEDGSVRHTKDAAKKFNEKEDDVLKMCKKISDALDGTSAKEKVSNGNFHQPTPIGPQ